jgi:hypothetical protein
MVPAVPTTGTPGGTGEDQDPAGDAAPEHAARRFLTGYLAYTYGRTRQLPLGATPELRQQLAAKPPRVPRDVRRLRPRARRLDATIIGMGADAQAIVVDGRRTYSVAVTLEWLDGEWVVTGVG